MAACQLLVSNVDNAAVVVVVVTKFFLQRG